ncbi:MAG: hypothetical protein U1A78_17335 [Polyangia bacterium]
MATDLISKAFEAGVKAALKLFQSNVGTKELAQSAEKVMKTMTRAVETANKIPKK